MNRKLSFRDLVELVTDYIEDALPAEERRRFEHTSCTAPAASVTGRLPREDAAR